MSSASLLVIQADGDERKEEEVAEEKEEKGEKEENEENEGIEEKEQTEKEVCIQSHSRSNHVPPSFSNKSFISYK
jgi:hypothetical protein